MNQTRRAFLISSAATAVTATAANSAISVGVIGTGNRGSFVAAQLHKHTQARVTALCDVVPEHMQQAAKDIGVENPKLFADYHKLLADPSIDAVIIATPVFLHAEHFEAAVQSGKHIYIEKPASADVAGCKRIMRAADGADRKVNITFGFQRRYSQLYLKGKQLADSGAIGPIHLGFARFIKSDGDKPGQPRRPEPKTDREKIAYWNEWKALNGDLIVENNIHSIDVLNWFLGGHPVSAIGSGGSKTRTQGDNRDHNFVAYDYGNGLEGQLSGMTLAPPGYREVNEQFFGAKGVIETSENHLKVFRGRGQETIEKTPRNNTIDSVAAFADRIAQGKPENTGVRGAESTLTAILGRMAMDARRVVTWDEMMKSAD